MALQHFYSRVPARMSMFHKADGYDTFACSAGLDQSFIERELLPVCEDRLPASEADLARRGKLTPVYVQFCTSDGRLVQSCISYLPLDYTGERSSYLVHSLIYDAAETEQILSVPDGGMFPCGMFRTDLSEWDVTSAAARPDAEYPEAVYVSPAENDWQAVLSRISPENLNEVFCACLSALCGKNKTVFLCTDSDPADTSGEVLDFIRTLIRVIPYHLRPLLSFCTRVGETARTVGFRFRGVSAAAGNMQGVRGVRIDLAHGATFGISESESEQNAPLCSFFRSLYRNDSLRREFLIFTRDAVGKLPSLGAPTLKNLNDIVFLFRSGSGLYPEKTVLPNDDALLELLTVYEKYRDALPEEARMNMMRSLRRYAQAQTEIPKKIFTRVIRLYAGEPACVRHLILSVVLELIHTDTMRDRLFAFLKGIYDGEEETTKEEILHHLCSVFYGGFLQQQILAFFDRNFAAGHYENMDEIFEKLLLSIRTKAVQESVLGMLERYYPAFDGKLKERFFDAVLEHLPEGDALAGALLALADRRLPEEEDTLAGRFLTGLTQTVDREQKTENHPMLSLIVRTDGICARTVGDRILRKCSGKPVFTEYIHHLCTASPEIAMLKLLDVRDRLSGLPGTVAKAFTETALRAIDSNFSRVGLGDWIRAQNACEEWMTEHADSGTKAFADRLYAECLLPSVGRTACEVFTNPACGVTPECMADLLETHGDLQAYDACRTVLAAVRLRQAIADGEPMTILQCANGITGNATVMAGIAGWLQCVFPENRRLNGVAGFAFFLAIGYLSGKPIRIEEIWKAQHASPVERTAAGNAAKKKQIGEAAQKDMRDLLRLLHDVRESDALSGQLKDALAPDRFGMRELLALYIGTQGKREAAALSDFVSDLWGDAEEGTSLREWVEGSLPHPGFLARIFGIKRRQ